MSYRVGYRVCSEETKLRIGAANRGRVFTLEHRRKLSEAHKGQLPPSPETVRLRSVKVAAALRGKKLSAVHRAALSAAQKKLHIDRPQLRAQISRTLKGKYAGSKSPQWRGGRMGLHRMIRQSEEYVVWRNSIFFRDGFKCQLCSGSKGSKRLHAHHHKETFKEILNVFLLLYPEYDPVKDCEHLLELAKAYSEFWDIDKGITVCAKCHGGDRSSELKRL